MYWRPEKIFLKRANPSFRFQTNVPTYPGGKGIKRCVGHIQNKTKIIPGNLWKTLEKIMEFCHYRQVGTFRRSSFSCSRALVCPKLLSLTPMLATTFATLVLVYLMMFTYPWADFCCLHKYWWQQLYFSLPVPKSYHVFVYKWQLMSMHVQI